MSKLRTTLQEKTHAIHQRLHQHPLLSPFVFGNINQQNYVVLLNAYKNYYSKLFEQMARHNFESPMLESAVEKIDADIIAMTAYEAHIPKPQINLKSMNLNEWYGAHYVLYGSQLGGRIIAKRIKEKLTHTNISLCFFEPPIQETTKNWHRFLKNLELNVNQTEACVDFAIIIFQQIENYFWEVFHALEYNQLTVNTEMSQK